MAVNRGNERTGTAPNGRGWRTAFLVFCTVGFCLSADLLRLHVNVHTNPDYHSYCAMSEHVNCDTVAASAYSVTLGLPMALWGLIVYAALGALSIWGLRRNSRGPSWPFGIMFWFCLALSLLGIFLYLVSHLVIESVCIVCGATYLVNFTLTFIAYVSLRRAESGPWRGLRDDLRSFRSEPAAVLIFGGVILLVLAGCWASVPPYWRTDAVTGPGGLPVGVTPEGHPWIGAREPRLSIVEYSDYQCPHCRRGHDEVRKLVLAHPKEVRVIHRQYPLDHHCNATVTRPFHPYACAYARISFCAQQQKRFWEANDFLFSNGSRHDAVRPEELAEQIGLDAAALKRCVESDEARRAIEKDLAAGQALRIRGTPTFVIRGRAYPGRIPSEVIAAALETGPPDPAP